MPGPGTRNTTFFKKESSMHEMFSSVPQLLRVVGVKEIIIRASHLLANCAQYGAGLTALIRPDQEYFKIYLF